MKEIHSFKLDNHCTNNSVTAKLYSPIDVSDVNYFENEWKPVLEKRHRKCISVGGNLSDWHVEDAGWSWRWKKGSYTDNRYLTFSIRADNKTEALMLCDIKRSSRSTKLENKCIVYIEYIHTAPWNRKVPNKSTPCLKGLGSLLLGVAIDLSIRLKCEGRIGLHALPQAESWYQHKCGMNNMGIDNTHENLVYFEMSADAANNFLNS